MPTTITLTTAIDQMGAASPSRARFTAIVRTAGKPAARTAGSTVTFPQLVGAEFDGTTWSPAPVLYELPAGFYWHTRVERDGIALERDVQLPGGTGATLAYAALIDVDPKTAAPSPAQLALFLAAIDQKVATQAALDAATYLPRWKPTTAYLAAAIVVNPSGQIVRRKADGTSGASYDPTAWDVVAGGAAAAGMTQQATQTASFAAAAGSFYPVDASAANVTVTLPAGSTPGQVIRIKKLDGNALAGAAAGIVQVVGTINGTAGATVPLRKRGMGKEYLADGSGGWTISLGDLDITQLGATATEQGFVALAGDLGGTAAAPTVPGLAGKASIADLAGKADLVGGLIPTSQIPSLALNTVVPVASRSAMLALTSTQVQPGDVAVDTSTGATRGSYMLLNADPSAIGSWVQLTAPTDVVTSVNGQTGAVVLGKGDVGLGNVDNTSDANKPVSTAQQSALNGKAPAAAGVPAGGAAGYTLVKGSGTDYDAKWIPAPGKAARVFKNDRQGFPNDTQTLVGLNTVGSNDDASIFDTTNAKQIGVKIAGLYLVSWYGNITATNPFALYVRSGNGTNTFQEAGAPTSTRLAAATVIRLAAGDNVQMWLYPNTSVAYAEGTGNSKDVGLALVYLGS